MERVKTMFLRGSFFFIVGVILATLFVWSMVQGILLHTMDSDSEIILLYYFAAWLAGIGALALYHQSKELIHLASISDSPIVSVTRRARPGGFSNLFS